MTLPGMELSRRRDSSLQRRAAQALADEAADAQLQRLVDDVAATGTSGATALSDVPGNTGMVSGVSGGDLLAGLQPIGPPMSFSPGDFLEPVRGETTKGEKNLEVKGENPEVKRVVVSEPSSDARRSDGADGNASGSPQNGNGKGQGGHVATGKGNGGTQQVTQGSRVRQAKNEPGQPSGLDRNVVGENPPQMWVTGDVVGKNEIPKNVVQQGSEKHVVHGQGVEGSMPSGLGVQSQVNPFWSPDCKREALREAYGPGYEGQDLMRLGFSAGFQDASQLGFSAGIQEPLQSVSNTTTPQKGYVEMDPVELFRLRCLRDAEERFRQGVLSLKSEPKREVGQKMVFDECCEGLGVVGGKEDGMKNEPSLQGSQSSFVSVPEPLVELFVPRPPPGPPPPSPPKVSVVGCGNIVGNVCPPPPVLPPFPPSITGFGPSSGVCGENPSENLRTVDLPKLSGDATAVQYGDWLSVVDTMMGDLSYTSETWWKMVRGVSDQCYQTWLISGPLERLNLKPQATPEMGMFPRTERRALSMLLAAIPENVRDEMIASRKLTVDQLLFRLSVLFQPGGSAERTKLLHMLTDGKCGNSVNEILEWLRQWRRNVQRAVELNVVLPDGIVLLGALSKCSDCLSQKSPQVAYRLNLVRQQLNLDRQPHTAVILRYSEHLQAEAEDLSLGAGGKNGDSCESCCIGC